MFAIFRENRNILGQDVAGKLGHFMLAVYPSSRSQPFVSLPPVTAVSFFPFWVAKTHFNH